MRRIARLITICLLLMAVPFKGAVAAGMVMCGPGHEGAQAAGVAGHWETAGESTPSHHHDHGSHYHARIGDGAHDHDAGTGEHSSPLKHGSVKCSICAACCIGGACLTSSAIPVPATVATEAHFPVLVVHSPWTILAGLERPPRTFLV